MSIASRPCRGRLPPGCAVPPRARARRHDRVGVERCGVVRPDYHAGFGAGFSAGHRAALVELLPTPAFDAAGLARISGWRPASKPGQPPASLSFASRDGVDVLQPADDRVIPRTLLQTRFSLPTGQYRIAGGVAVLGERFLRFDSSVRFPGRVAASRFAYQRRSLGSGDIDVTFQVSDSVSPEEIELTFEVPGGMSEAWIHASALTLIRLDR